MKKRKIEKTYIYHGFGFPIVLENVPMVEVRDIWTPDINFNVFQRVVLLQLTHQEFSLSGNQIRFIRKYFALTLQQFGKKFGVTHGAVLKWEKKGDSCTDISVTTEREIRLYILDELLPGAKEFRNAYRHLAEQSFSDSKRDGLHIDAQRALIAV